MIIELSPADKNIKNDAPKLADQYSEKATTFNKDCFKECEDERLTFLGHASTNFYGDQNLTPEQFAQKLLDYGLPPTVRIIDLVGCEIGAVTSKKSYVRRVAEILHGLGFDIRVNAFISKKLNENDGMRVSLGFASVVKDAKVYDKKFNELTSERKKLTNEIKQIQQTKKPAVVVEEDHKDDILKKIQSIKTEIFSNNPEISHRRLKLMMIDLIEFDELDRKFIVRENVSLKMDDIRNTLDNEERFQICPPQNIHGLKFEFKEAVKLLLHRVAELQDLIAQRNFLVSAINQDNCKKEVAQMKELLSKVIANSVIERKTIADLKDATSTSEATKRVLRKLQHLINPNEIELAPVAKLNKKE